MPRYALYIPFSLDADDDQTAALVANLLAHRNALLLAEDGRVVGTIDTPLPDRLLSPEDLRVRGPAVAAALETVAAGHTGERVELDRRIEQALAASHPGSWSRVTVLRRVYYRWMSTRNNPVTAHVHLLVNVLASRIRDLLADMTQVIRV